MIAFEQLLKAAAAARYERIVFNPRGADLDDGQLRKSWPQYISAPPPFTAVMGL
jgi:hypothetical protein